jgi:hypothetical protein
MITQAQDRTSFQLQGKFVKLVKVITYKENFF